MSTASALRGKRQIWGQSRKWEGNYLSLPGENTNSSLFNTSMNNLKNSEGFRHILFSTFVHKTNKHKKTADRAIVITNDQIYKIDTTKFKPMKKGLLINQVRRNYSHLFPQDNNILRKSKRIQDEQ